MTEVRFIQIVLSVISPVGCKLGAKKLPDAFNCLHLPTHPATAERYIQIKKTVEEINDKKAKGLALVPNEKEKPKIKKKEKKKID